MTCLAQKDVGDSGQVFSVGMQGRGNSFPGQQTYSGKQLAVGDGVAGVGLAYA